MDKYVCVLCGYVYDPAEGDPENGVLPGTAFEDLPEGWLCPACGVGVEHFEKERWYTEHGRPGIFRAACCTYSSASVKQISSSVILNTQVNQDDWWMI